MNFSKLFSVLFLSLAVLVSCSDDENAPSIDVTQLPGSWTVTNYTTESSVSAAGATAKTEEIYTEGTMRVSFTEEPAEVSTSGNFTVDILVQGSNEGTNTYYSIPELNGSYAINGSNVTFGTGETAVDYQILELSATTFKFKMEESTTEEFFGITTTTKSVKVITLTKDAEIVQ
ncbi:hypothetical protein [Marinigracilibium pacificum]|uniref:Lipocalin-like domain-containing protein n=1 Tax=Marinigracilibium pacificum TaxID=2729599 RepID=A0A848IZS0_9BACT|nr:hypothetical protein [Marinigracilibium pacificum]NMM47489.1 hypothetical protein [Marinigracilibium pacificum]